MSSVEAVVKNITLDLSDIPREKQAAAKKKVGNYLVNSILREVGQGKSPVEGETFKKLTKEYAKKEHGGRRLPILELEGDMLSALKFTDLGDNRIEVGIRGEEAPKADGHNQISLEAKSWAARTDRTQYKRRFIPDDRQKFKDSIVNGIDDILEGFRERPREVDPDTETLDLQTVETAVTTPDTNLLTVNEFFSDDVIEELIRQARARRE